MWLVGVDQARERFGGRDHRLGHPGCRACGDAEAEPGKISALLDCAIVCRTPPWSTGSKGEPVATRALPSVHFRRSSGVASARLVGLDSGMMIGRVAWRAISVTISAVKAPPLVEVPISTVGRTSRMTSVSVRWVPLAASQLITLAWGVGALEVHQRRIVLDEQALAAECHKSATAPRRG